METISNYRLEEIIATITELSKGKKRDLYNFLISLKSNTSIDSKTIKDIQKSIKDLNDKKVDKDGKKVLSTNDFTNALKEKLKGITSNVRANWNQTDKNAPDYILNKPNNYNPNDYELKSNKVTSISSQSTDKQYPSAKCVYDIVGNIESVLDNILGN